ncbi:prolyl oligopeptidase family serine peptidase [Leptotrichia massiliensis]|uniref:prolyl oligopeptidase family serine peptidase n=1 Tax=Leptotrichia massiliensis TaxID=1852388 RepID=UPI0028D7150E|nr:prolyl oligopeptidase family serine peptidase [Leptotrichia massiliensis]
MKKNLVIILFIMLIAGVIGNAVTRGNRKRVSRKKIGNVKVSEKTVDLSNYNGVKKVSIFVQGFESGPAVSKVILEMADYRITNLDRNDWKIKTNGFERKVMDVYVSNKKGEKAFDTGIITLELENKFNPDTLKYEGSPFAYNRQKFFNEWVKEYVVEIEGKVTIDGKDYLVNKKEDVINNRVSTDTELFNYRSSFSGNYKNPITKKIENLKLEMAAYEPENFKLGAKKPLIVWLHGQGEGGTDPDIDILGTETSALAKEEIQKYFTAGGTDTKGAFVLAVQSPTYWMDEGDGTNGNGSGNSRYTQILMDTIKEYVKHNPYVDTSRIYLAGDSNGGYMTVNMIITYPDYFAAAVPICEAYAYHEYARNSDGTYKTNNIEVSAGGKNSAISRFVETKKLWVTNEKIQKMKKTPVWFIAAADDGIVTPKKFSLPTYRDLLRAGADNAWYSYYENVVGTDVPNSRFPGHFSWIYFLNNQVEGVQNRDKIKNSKDTETFGFEPSNAGKGGSEKANINGKVFKNVFEWMNFQKKSNRK